MIPRPPINIRSTGQGQGHRVKKCKKKSRDETAMRLTVMKMRSAMHCQSINV